MKRSLLKTFSITLAFILLLSVCACAGNGQETETPAPDGQQVQATAEPMPTPEPTEAPTPELTPEPTEAPTPEPPEDEWFIQTAWSYGEIFSEIHELHCRTEEAEVVRRPSDPNDPSSRLSGAIVSFPIENSGSSVPVYLTVQLRSNNGQDFGLEKINVRVNDPDYGVWRTEREIDRWEGELNALQIVLTPEDIAASGCTATEGDEYLDAVGQCFQQKLTEIYLSFPEDSPIHFIEVRPLGCNRTEYLEGDYEMLFAVRSADPLAADILFENACSVIGFYGNPYGEEFSGWLLLHGFGRVTRQEDGSWIGGVTIGGRG